LEVFPLFSEISIYWPDWSVKQLNLRNVLLNYAPQDPLAVAARLAVGISMLFGYPMQFAGTKSKGGVGDERRRKRSNIFEIFKTSSHGWYTINLSIKVVSNAMTGGSDGLRDPRISRTSGGANPHVRYDWMSLQWAFLKKRKKGYKSNFNLVVSWTFPTDPVSYNPTILLWGWD